MSRRSASFLDQMARDRLKWANGEIQKVSGLWQFVGANLGKPLDNGFVRKATCHSTGKEMELVNGPAAHCPNPEMDGQYPMITDPPKKPQYSVPLKRCQKCPHYGKRGEERMPYPFCKWAKADRGGAVGAAKSLLETLSRAVEMTSEIMGGAPHGRVKGDG